MSPAIGVQTLFINAATGELSRLIIKRKGDQVVRDLRRLTCPYSHGIPCSLDCAVLGASLAEDSLVLIWCRGGGNRVILGSPDPETTDLDEMEALTSASLFAEQQQSQEDKNQ